MKKRFVAVVALALGAAWWWLGGSDAKETQYLFDRPWVSEIPKDPREAFHGFMLSKKHEAGIAMVGSRYQHLVSALGFELKSDRLQLNFLQQELKVASKVKTWKCKEAPKDLDLCLELDFRLKKVRLYSSTKWGRAKEVPEHLRWPIPEAAGTCEGCAEGTPSWVSSL